MLRLPRAGALCLVLAIALCTSVARADSKHDEEVAYGDIVQILVPAVGYGLTFAYDDAEGRSQFYWSYFTTLGITYAMKGLIPDQRPGGGNFQSYVSGHTASAFAGAAFMQMRYGWWWGLPAYGAALYVARSRVDEENPSHYQDDVTRGAVIAIATTWYFTTRYPERAAALPVVAPGYLGVALRMGW